MQKTQSDIVAKKEENVTSNQKKIDELELEISQKNAELTQLKEKNTNLTEDIKWCRSEIAKLNSELVEQSNLKQKELLIKSQCDDQVNFAMAQLKHKEDDVKVSIFYIADFNCSQSNFSNHAGHCYAIFLSTSFVISNCCLSDSVLSENERERQIFKDLKDNINDLTKQLIGQKALTESAINDKNEKEAKMKENIETIKEQKQKEVCYQFQVKQDSHIPVYLLWKLVVLHIIS